MQKASWMVLGAILLTGIISSCKKGEEDPFLSLRSRKARLVGEWTLKTRTLKVISPTYTLTDEYADGQNHSMAVHYEAGVPVDTQISVNDYAQTYTFEKDGTYELVTVLHTGKTVEEGVWSFIRKSKADGLKNKEAILLTRRKYAAPDGGPILVDGYIAAWPRMAVLTRLKHQELAWVIASYSSSDPYGTSSTTITETFEQ